MYENCCIIQGEVVGRHSLGDGFCVAVNIPKPRANHHLDQQTIYCHFFGELQAQAQAAVNKGDLLRIKGSIVNRDWQGNMFIVVEKFRVVEKGVLAA